MAADGRSAGDMPAGEWLAAWRARGADRLDPLRFHLIEVLQRRAAAQEGETRHLLEQRVSALVAAYSEDLARAEARGGIATDAGSPESVRSPLGGLLDYFATRTMSQASDIATNEAMAPAATAPQPAMLGEVRQLWTMLRAESQLRESLRQAPLDAGPLNSGRLVHRALELMRDASPGYLQHFLSYADALAWMEQIGDDAASPSSATNRAAAGGKRATAKPRKRQS